MRTAVVVIGDLARSPRTVLHARALAEAGIEVDLVGIGDAEWPDGARPPRLTIWPLRGGAATEPWSPVSAAVRGISLSGNLLSLLLWRLPRPDVVLVQNPPGVPTLFVAWAAARMRSAGLVVDWHNLTSAVLATRLAPTSIAIRVTAAYEGLFGRWSDLNLFVSDRMRQALFERWGLHGISFPDRPARVFVPLGDADRIEARRALLKRVGEDESRDRPLMIAPTSWTADEDFELLREALVRYDAGQSAGARDGVASAVLVITGRGPRQKEFSERLAAVALHCVRVHCVWLEPEDYARSVAAADVVLSVHRSASGLDIPMKVIDAAGAGVPVCAFDYGDCLREQVTDGENGLLFRSADELSDRLTALFAGYPESALLLRQLRQGAARRSRITWEQAWRHEILPAIERLHWRDSVAPIRR